MFDPDGRIVARTRKVFLTPPEEDPALLNLRFGDLRDLRVVDPPVGRLGIMISKDAWMADGGATLRAPASRVEAASDVVTPENLLYAPALALTHDGTLVLAWHRAAAAGVDQVESLAVSP